MEASARHLPNRLCIRNVHSSVVLYAGMARLPYSNAHVARPGIASDLGRPAHRYWMVPLLGVQAGSVSLPVTARGAILDSSSAFSLVTDKDFLIFEVSSSACVACKFSRSAIPGSKCFPCLEEA